MKILLSFGTRPEAIKMAPIIFELRRQKINHCICVTSQHREMLDQVLEFFQISPDYDLNLMATNQGLNVLSANILKELDVILDKEQPDLMLVQGDTTTAFISALTAFNKKIKIGHVEAGLRTYNRMAPFPEEGNRQLLSKIVSYNFVPTERARENLIQEGIDNKDIFLTGNTVVDALRYGRWRLSIGYRNELIIELSKRIIKNKKLILVTGHRRENFGFGIEQVCEALKEIAKREDVQIFFPVHLNPKIKLYVNNVLYGYNNIFLLEPVNYPCMLWLLEKCDFIISDSGGIQEEAPSFMKTVLVTREVTERKEGVASGFCVIVGTDKNKIVYEAEKLLNGRVPDYSEKANPFGDGYAARKIVKELQCLI